MDARFESTENQYQARRWIVRLVLLVLMSAAAFALERTTELAARAEAQNAADAAALAGAAFLMANPDDEWGARATAIQFAQLNLVRGSTPELRPENVHVNLEEGVVRVKVRAKVLPLPPPIAWLRVTAEAAAEAMAVPPPGDPARRSRTPKMLRLID